MAVSWWKVSLCKGQGLTSFCCPVRAQVTHQAEVKPELPLSVPSCPGRLRWPGPSATFSKIRVSHSWAPSQASGSQAPSPSLSSLWGSQEILGSLCRKWLGGREGSGRVLRQWDILLGPRRPFYLPASPGWTDWVVFLILSLWTAAPGPSLSLPPWPLSWFSPWHTCCCWQSRLPKNCSSGGPVVKTLCFQRRGSILGWGTKIPHALGMAKKTPAGLNFLVSRGILRSSPSVSLHCDHTCVSVVPR